MIGAAMMITVQREMSSSMATTRPSSTAMIRAILSRRCESQRVSLVGAGAAGGGTAGWLTGATLPRWGADPRLPPAAESAARSGGLLAIVEEAVDGRARA